MCSLVIISHLKCFRICGVFVKSSLFYSSVKAIWKEVFYEQGNSPRKSARKITHLRMADSCYFSFFKCHLNTNIHNFIDTEEKLQMYTRNIKLTQKSREEKEADKRTLKRKSDIEELANTKKQKTLLANSLSALLEGLIQER